MGETGEAGLAVPSILCSICGMSYGLFVVCHVGCFTFGFFKPALLVKAGGEGSSRL